MQPIQPGAVNLMTAGRGIVHSERAGQDVDATSRLHGIQLWIALPADQEECEPAFEHYPAIDIPELDVADARVRVIMGEAYGHVSPVTSYSPMVYLEYRIPKGTAITLPESHPELAAYVVAGNVRIDRDSVTHGVKTVARYAATVRPEADADSHVLVVGRAPVGERHIWWNFVSSSTERIEKAKVDWKEGRFTQVPGEDEFHPVARLMNASRMLTIEELSARYARPGRLEWIGLRSRRRGPVTPVQTVELIQDSGLEGDYSADGSGGRRQVTLIQWEHLAVIADLCGESIIAPERLRRNLVASGVNLFSLRARRFRLGDALREGTGHCPPCSRMELELGHGGFNAMRGHGGITARVLTSGTVSVGSPLVPVD